MRLNIFFRFFRNKIPNEPNSPSKYQQQRRANKIFHETASDFQAFQIQQPDLWTKPFQRFPPFGSENNINDINEKHNDDKIKYYSLFTRSPRFKMRDYPEFTPVSGNEIFLRALSKKRMELNAYRKKEII
jgi:hypothetical protein